MKLGVMQPYFLAYLGYWQLINYVDKYVVYDDVNYIKQGWINRNRICIGSGQKYITVPLCAASSNKKIFEINVDPGFTWRRKMLRTFRQNFHWTKYFDEAFPLLESILGYKHSTLDEFLYNQLLLVAKYLDINTTLVSAKSVYSNQCLSGQQRILDICRQEAATIYVNSVGGLRLYSAEAFHKCGLELKFLETLFSPEIEKKCNGFPNCSILQLACLVGRDGVREELDSFRLIEGDRYELHKLGR